MEEKKHEEVDLASVARGLKSIFIQLGRAISKLSRYTWENLEPIMLFTIVFALLFFGLAFTKPPFYNSIASFAHMRLNNDYVFQMINNLRFHLDEKNGNEKLGEVLKLDKEAAKAVKTIVYRPINVEFTRKHKDSVRVLLPFEIAVEVYDNSILDTLEGAILNYLENNPYALRRRTLDEQTLEDAERRIDHELKQIDSLKHVVSDAILPRAQGNGIILGEPVDPVRVSERATTLYELKQDLQRRRRLNNSFEVMVGFTADERIVGPRKGFYTLFGGILGYLTGLLYVSRRNRWKQKRTAA